MNFHSMMSIHSPKTTSNSPIFQKQLPSEMNFQSHGHGSLFMPGEAILMHPLQSGQLTQLHSSHSRSLSLWTSILLQPLQRIQRPICCSFKKSGIHPFSRSISWSRVVDGGGSLFRLRTWNQLIGIDSMVAILPSQWLAHPQSSSLGWSPFSSSDCALSFVQYNDELRREWYLAVVIWLRENVCQWDSSTSGFAAFNGHLEIVKWLKENWCPWDERQFKGC